MGLIYGVNPVLEQLITAPGQVEMLHLPKGPLRGQLGRIARQARELGVHIVYVDRKTLNRLADGAAHQGVVGRTSDYQYTALDALLSQIDTQTRIVLLDGVQDPHNLGAIVRTAVCAGAAGIVIPERNSASMTAAAVKASAGAAAEATIVRVKNLVRVLEVLKERDVWTVAVEADGERQIGDLDPQLSYAFVFGGEGQGVRRLVRESCDMSVSIPMRGSIGSLNVSVSVGVTLYSVFA